MAALTEQEIEAMRLRAWKFHAQGRSVRWRMIRDVLAVVSVSWMTWEEIQVCMTPIWGLTRNKTRELLEEMVSIGDCQAETDDKTHELKYHLNPDRVKFWLGLQGIEGIPAGIVEVVEITRSALKSEV